MGSCGSRPSRTNRSASDTTRQATAGKNNNNNNGISEGSKTNAAKNSSKTPIATTFLPSVVIGDQPRPPTTAAASSIHHDAGSPRGVASRRWRRQPSTDCEEGALALLPIELLRYGVMSFLDAGCLARAGGACRVWREAATDEHLWKRLCLRHWAGKHVGERER